MTTNKTTARQAPKDPTPPPCSVCDGTGEVSRTVRVGRGRRAVGEQTGLCLTCMGSGTAAGE